MWGWTDRAQKGKKGKKAKRGKKASDYALVGGTEGTVIVDISKPTRPDVLGILPAHTPSTRTRRSGVTSRSTATTCSSSPSRQGTACRSST
jgi:hypothetical protein